MQSSTASGVDAFLAAAAFRAKARAQRARNDHRHAVTIQLVEIDRQILHMRVKARTATGSTKPRLDDALALIAERRAKFAAQLEALEGTPTSVWVAAKAMLDLECVALKTFVEQVGAAVTARAAA